MKALRREEEVVVRRWERTWLVREEAVVLTSLWTRTSVRRTS